MNRFFFIQSSDKPVIIDQYAGDMGPTVTVTIPPFFSDRDTVVLLAIIGCARPSKFSVCHTRSKYYGQNWEENI